MLKFFILFLVIISFDVFASQKALIKNEKAIVYADTAGSSVVGFIPLNRLVVVGEKPRGLLRMYPIIVSAKICYIKESDLNFVAHQGVRNDHTIENKIESTPSDFFKKTSIGATYQFFNAGSDWSNLSTRYNGRSSNTNIKNNSFKFIKEFRYVDLGVGVETFSASDGVLKLSEFAFSGEISKLIYQYKSYSFRPSFTYYSTPTSSGIRGVKLSIPLYYRVLSDLDLVAGVGYQSATVSGNSKIVQNYNSDIDLASYSFIFGLHYFF